MNAEAAPEALWDFAEPPRPLDGPEFEEFAHAFILHLLVDDPWAGDLTTEDVRDIFTPDPPPCDDTS